MSSTPARAGGTVLVSLVLALLVAAPAAARDVLIANGNENSISVIDSQTAAVVDTIPGVPEPHAISITPDGRHAYVAGLTSHAVTVIDIESRAVIDSINVGGNTWRVAVSPDGTRAYATVNTTNRLRVIDTQTNSLLGPGIVTGGSPIGVAVSPDGSRVYTANVVDDSISVIDTQTEVEVATIPTGEAPRQITLSPDGARAFVTVQAPAGPPAGRVQVIDLAPPAAVIDEIEAGEFPSWTGLTPDGSRAYITASDSDEVTVVDTQTLGTVTTIGVGSIPTMVATTPSGERAFVTNQGSDSVSVIDTSTNQVVGGPIHVGDTPRALAIMPNRSPSAHLQAPASAPLGEPVTFDAQGSSDPDGAISSYVFAFGDGTVASGSQPVRQHAFSEMGTFSATVTVDDGEGCPGFVFTGETAHCAGPSVVTSSVSEVLVGEPLPPVVEEPFRLGLRLGERPQRSLRRIRMEALCTATDCRAMPAGAVRARVPGRGARTFRFRGEWRWLRQDAPRTIRLAVPRRAGLALRRALRAGGGGAVRVRVRARDGLRERDAVRQAPVRR